MRVGGKERFVLLGGRGIAQSGAALEGFAEHPAVALEAGDFVFEVCDVQAELAGLRAVEIRFGREV